MPNSAMESFVCSLLWIVIAWVLSHSQHMQKNLLMKRLPLPFDMSMSMLCLFCFFHYFQCDPWCLINALHATRRYVFELGSSRKNRTILINCSIRFQCCVIFFRLLCVRFIRIFIVMILEIDSAYSHTHNKCGLTAHSFSSHIKNQIQSRN